MWDGNGYKGESGVQFASKCGEKKLNVNIPGLHKQIMLDTEQRSQAKYMCIFSLS